jgi:hypothetical protein
MGNSKLHNGHWTSRDFVQRMTADEWREVLLTFGDQVMYKGHLVRLKATDLGYGVVEVRKDFNGRTKEEPK